METGELLAWVVTMIDALGMRGLFTGMVVLMALVGFWHAITDR